MDKMYNLTLSGIKRRNMQSSEKGLDSLSGKQQGRDQVRPIRRSQRLLTRETRETVEKIKAEFQEIMRKEEPATRKVVTAALPARGSVQGRGGSRPGRQTRMPRHLANQELSSPKVSGSWASEDDPDMDEFVAAEENEDPDVNSDKNDEDFTANFVSPPNVVREGGQKACDACGAGLAPDETLTEHLVSIHLTREGLCDICGEDPEDFVEHFFTAHLGKELNNEEMRMVKIKVEVMEEVEESVTNFFTGKKMIKSFEHFPNDDGFKWQIFGRKGKGPSRYRCEDCQQATKKRFLLNNERMKRYKRKLNPGAVIYEKSHKSTCVYDMRNIVKH